MGKFPSRNTTIEGFVNLERFYGLFSTLNSDFLTAYFRPPNTVFVIGLPDNETLVSILLYGCLFNGQLKH